MLYGRPLLSHDLLTDPETGSLLNHIMDIGTFQQAIQKLGHTVLPAPMKEGKLQIELGEQVVIKSWKEGAPADKFQPKWTGSYTVISAMPLTVKAQGIIVGVMFIG
jgi:hypothetical protein